MTTDLDHEGKFWSDKLMDLANLVSIVLVFGQIGAKVINLKIVIADIVIFVEMVFLSFVLRKR